MRKENDNRITWRGASLALLVLQALANSASAQPTIITNIPVASGSLDAVNPTLNRIYITDGGNSTPQTQVIDGNLFAPITVVAGWGASVDLTNNNLWTADVYSGTAMVYNSNNTLVTSIYVGDCPMGVNVDAPHRLAWVSAQCGSDNDPDWAIEADTYAMVCGPIGSGGVQGATMVNPATGRFYLAPGGVSKELNPSSCALTDTSFGTVIGVNPTANLLYAQSSSDTLQILNAEPVPEVVLANVTLPFNFNGSIGVNPVLNRIYLGNNGSSNIAILNAATGQSIESFNLPGGVTSVQEMAVDATRNRVYATVVLKGNNVLYALQDAPLLSINMYAGLTIYAPVGSTNEIQYVTTPSNTKWTTLTNLVVPTNPYIFIDYTSAGQPQRFYRDVQE